ncbi:M23 family metallopeptidase [Arthrobacter sp. NPDC092385]|uniref:M23 family metallopeptidase n=1 Tax=Arthrobacter sp. NPDC092385 TaxID=3363943 RepID=UPI00381A21BD
MDATAAPQLRRTRRRPRVPHPVIVLAMVLALMSSSGSAVASQAAPGTPGSSAHRQQVLPGGDLPLSPAAFVPEWSWPLLPAPAVLRPFEKPPRTWQRGHRGVDLSAATGQPVSVASPADGVVSFAGTVVDRGVLSIDHGGGRVSSFEPVTTDRVEGDRVSRGDAVATLQEPGAGGPAAHCGLPCLHWGVREHGEYVDPLSFVTDRRPSVLLPLTG